MNQYFYKGKDASTWSRTTRLLASLLLVVILSGCASMSAFESGLQPFSTDGCSLFPDRSYITKADWCSCCLAHDLAYWRGGTEQDRLNADIALKNCVQQSTKNPVLANLMFEGVRLGGGPYFFTSYRWGYGWKVGRAYTPLTKEEGAEADRLESAYRINNPQLVCDSKLGQGIPSCQTQTPSVHR